MIIPRIMANEIRNCFVSIISPINNHPNKKTKTGDMERIGVTKEASEFSKDLK